MAVTSIRSNSMPTGGPTAQQSVQPIGQMTPQDIAALVDQLIPAVQKFRASSTIEKSILNAVTWSAQGGQNISQISSVGLGLKLVMHHHIVIPIVNGSTAAQTFKPSPDFPYNLISNTSVQINGGATVYSASGIGGLYVLGRRFRSFFETASVAGGYGPQLNPAMSNVLIGANGTATNADAAGIPIQLSGIKSVSVAGSSTANITVDFVTEHWFVMDYESMLGALPLQNNSTYATVTTTLAPTFISTSSTNMSGFPLYNAGANLSVGTVSGTTYMEYHYASVPSDATLYQAIVSNSYQVQEQPGVTGATGVLGLTYNIPQNQYLVALHRRLYDGNGSYLNAFSSNNGIGNMTAEITNYASATNASNRRIIQYNGGAVIPVQTTDFQMLRGDQYREYGNDLGLLAGYLLWDGEATSNDVQAATDNMGWIDCYNVASPQHAEDLGSSISGTPTAIFTRESVVAGSVSVVGG